MAALLAQRARAAAREEAAAAVALPSSKIGKKEEKAPVKHMKGYYYDEQTDRYYKRTGWGAPPFDRFIDRKESSEKTAARGNSSDQLESSGHIAGIFELLKRRECGRIGPFIRFGTNAGVHEEEEKEEEEEEEE
jgi:hypothetical protein